MQKSFDEMTESCDSHKNEEEVTEREGEREREGTEGRIKLHSNHSRGSLCKIFTSSFSCNKHSSQLLRTCDNKLAVLYLSLVLLSGIIVVMVLNISGNQSRFSGSTQVWIF